MAEVNIIFEDDSILVTNKPAGIGTQAPRQFDSLEARVRAYLSLGCEPDYTPYLGIPHRIDRCVSGVVLFAKRKKAAQRLARQFERREVEKTYRATVHGKLPATEGTWEDVMRKVPEEPRSEMVTAGAPGAKRAVLHFQVLHAGAEHSQVEIQLETGRMHQIRLQCGHRGHAILGDAMYGSTVPFGPVVTHEREKHIALHAERLTVQHPRTREEMTFVAAFPASW